ncbi:MAG: 30S ribosomal protein S1 [Deltaproteobacteria bacterium]|jgi:small subunit ribosomal protein S1|nr:30S ribosomal protein S1 [Deltaproteobacteria bacterium]
MTETKTTETKTDNQKLSFAELLEQTEKTFKSNTVVTGKIIKILPEEEKVVVDIGYKSEGMIDIEEFQNASDKIDYESGDEVEVFISSLSNEKGRVTLSKEKADKLKIWEEIDSALDKEKEIDGTIKRKVKGGLSVLIKGGIKAFLPGSQVDLRPVSNLEKYIGEKYKFKIIKFNKRRGNIVLSRRAILEKERAKLKEETLSKLKEGELVDGIIKNVTDYGAFIDLGGVDGLLHITDMSWGRVTNPRNMLKVNDEITVKVLKYDPETEKVSLGLKQTTEDPWLTAKERYKPGTVVRGRVVSLKDYGAFIELEEGIEGLIHVSEMSWTKHIKHPRQILKKEDVIEAVVLDIDAENTRISLGMKQLEPNPYEALKEKYPVGTKINGKVRNIADFGIFVEIEEGIDGLAHISDLSWIQKIKHPSELYNKGDEIEVVILNIDVEDEKPKISLGVKQLVPDPWTRIPSEYAVGSVVEGKVLNVTDFGAFVELEEGIDGLVHISEISEDHIEDPKEVLEKDDTIKVSVIGLDMDERRISLSIKAAERVEQLSSQGGGSISSAGPNATIGDVFGSVLKDAVSEEDKKEKAEEKAEEKSEDKTEDKSEEKAEDKTEDKSEEKTEEKSEDKSEEKTEKESEDKSEEKTEKKAEDKTEEKSEEKTEEKSEEKSEEKTEEKSEEKTEE